MTPGTSAKRRGGRALAAMLAVLFVLQAGVKWRDDALADVLWLSNAALLMSAAGLWFDRRGLVAVALLWVGVPHAVWITDFVGLLVTGESRLGVVSYWPTADAWVRAGTAFHLFLLPVLLWVAATRGLRLRPWLPAGSVAFLVLLVVSRLWSTPAANVNWVYRVELNDGAWGVVDAFNAQPDTTYVLALGVVMAAGAFWPTAVLVDALLGRGPRGAAWSAGGADALPA